MQHQNKDMHDLESGMHVAAALLRDSLGVPCQQWKEEGEALDTGGGCKFVLWYGA